MPVNHDGWQPAGRGIDVCGISIGNVAGDNAKAKQEVISLVESMGFAPVDVGALLEAGAALGGKSLARPQIAQRTMPLSTSPGQGWPG